MIFHETADFKRISDVIIANRYDCSLDDVKDKAAAITPVPGGVGPMTVAMLLHNTYQAYLLQHDKL